MNERIKELEKQSGMSIGQELKIVASGENIGRSIFVEKFAELIVDECCLKLLDMDEKTKGNHNYYRHAAIEIKKHFGVNE